MFTSRDARAEFAFAVADYYPVMARCVADVERNTAARHEFYLLARTELEIQLCGFDPALTPADMMRERLALDEAIRRVEKEYSSPAATIVQSTQVHLETDNRGQQLGPTLEPASIWIRPVVALLLVIGLSSTLYWQRDQFAALFAGSVTFPHSMKSLPKLDYYVGKLGELALTARRQVK